MSVASGHDGHRAEAVSWQWLKRSPFVTLVTPWLQHLAITALVPLLVVAEMARPDTRVDPRRGDARWTGLAYLGVSVLLLPAIGLMVGSAVEAVAVGDRSWRLSLEQARVAEEAARARNRLRSRSKRWTPRERTTRGTSGP